MYRNRAEPNKRPVKRKHPPPPPSFRFLLPPSSEVVAPCPGHRPEASAPPCQDPRPRATRARCLGAKTVTVARGALGRRRRTIRSAPAASSRRHLVGAAPLDRPVGPPGGSSDRPSGGAPLAGRGETTRAKALRQEGIGSVKALPSPAAAYGGESVQESLASVQVLSKQSGCIDFTPGLHLALLLSEIFV